jgi:hypothetical protein
LLLSEILRAVGVRGSSSLKKKTDDTPEDFRNTGYQRTHPAVIVHAITAIPCQNRERQFYVPLSKRDTEAHMKKTSDYS